MHFNPRSPHGERPTRRSTRRITRMISIHAPRMGSDHSIFFLLQKSNISIHAPRMGSDSRITVTAMSTLLFQSTLPAWGATVNPIFIYYLIPISIHAPRMGSDNRAERHCGVYEISIHAPRMGSDGSICAKIATISDFNPRSPHGERHLKK